ncbi:MAG: septal ring lytic transglycosylase RlpA family protein [Alphaproteobacteria bacterium]|nr:MAG: septal ring lytic transglycosylase RlpA family protein [Alphaproteobacteria bacterium]
MLLWGCASTDNSGHYSDYFSRYYEGIKTIAPTKATSRSYTIRGVRYKPQEHYEYISEGYASYYGGRDIFHGRRTSTGEIFSKDGLTAAHRTLPLPCVVKVTNLENGRSIRVKVNDRGPFASPEKRIIDLSERAAKILGFYEKGTARVRIEAVVDDSVRVAKGARTYSRGSRRSFFTPTSLSSSQKKSKNISSARTPLRVAYRDRSDGILRAIKPSALPHGKRGEKSTYAAMASQKSHHVLHMTRVQKRPQPLPKSKSPRMNMR